jgi:hypothetical protein
MSLTPPSQVTFFLAVLLTVFSLLVRYTHVDIPIVSGHSYETLLVGLLAATCGQPIPRILTSPSNLLRSPRGLDSTRNFLRAKFELRSRCTSPIGSLGGSHKARGSKPSPGRSQHGSRTRPSSQTELYGELDVRRAVSRDSPPTIILRLITCLREVGYNALDSVNCFFACWIRIGNDSPVDHILVRIESKLNDLKGHFHYQSQPRALALA